MLRVENIKLDELANALEAYYSDYETFNWLDPATGNVEFWSEVIADEAEAEGWDVDDRGGIRIEPISAHDAFRHMEQFVATVQEPLHREHLEECLAGSKPFRHFKAALHRYYPALEEDWFAFHRAAMNIHAVEWLRDNEVVDENDAEAALARLRAEGMV